MEFRQWRQHISKTSLNFTVKRNIKIGGGRRKSAMKGARQTGPHGLRALSPPVRGPRPGPAGTPAGRGWPGPGAVPLRALTCHGQPRAKASVPGKRPRQTRGHLSGAATVCHAACPEADLQPPAGRQHARSPALGRGPGQALLVPCTQNKHPAFGGLLSLRKKKKKMQIKLTVTIVF